MKRQINLYGAEFRPKRQWASLNQMALVWGFALLLILFEIWSFLVYGGIEEMAYPAD